ASTVARMEISLSFIGLSTERQYIASRAVKYKFVLGLAALLQVHVPGLPEHRVANIFRPLATPGASEKQVAIFTLAITGVIFLCVASLIVYTVWRFRRKPNDHSAHEPPQVYGS